MKLYLLLCVSYDSFIKIRKMEQTRDMRKNKKRYIDTIQEIFFKEMNKINSKLIIVYMKKQNPTFSKDNITDSDLRILRELVMIIEQRPEFYSHRIAMVMVSMFGASRRPLNRFLNLLKFKSIGNLGKKAFEKMLSDTKL